MKRHFWFEVLDPYLYLGRKDQPNSVSTSRGQRTNLRR